MTGNRSSVGTAALSERESTQPFGQPRQNVRAHIREGDAEMTVLPRSEASRQAEHASLGSEPLGDLAAGPALERMPQVGEIGADGIDAPPWQRVERGPEHVDAVVDFGAVRLAPRAQPVDGPGQRRLGGRGAQIWMQSRSGGLGDKPGIGRDGAGAVPGDRVDFEKE